MQTQNRAAPHFLLALLTLLSVGAILFSLTQAPPVARTQLRTAASNTAGLSSFRLAFTETLAPLRAPVSSAPRRSEAIVIYQAPDRVQDTVVGQSITGLVIGPRHYRRAGKGAWQYLGQSVSASGAQVAQELVLPLQLVAGATGVTRKGSGTFSFTPSNQQLLLATLFGGQVSSLAPTGATYRATVHGEYLSVLQIAVVGTTARATVELAFSDLDHAPALEAPALG
jgi:hypothetical protein